MYLRLRPLFAIVWRELLQHQFLHQREARMQRKNPKLFPIKNIPQMASHMTIVMKSTNSWIDYIVGDKTRVKVLILWPNGEMYVRVPSSEESILLVKNIALQKWKAAANTVFKHKDLQPEVFKTLWWVLNKEMQEYTSSDCILKGRSPEELIAFSNRLFVCERTASELPCLDYMH